MDEFLRDLLHTRTARELRELLERTLTGDAYIWLRVSGLTANHWLDHSALQTSLRRTGLLGDVGTPIARVVVWDWTHATSLDADGFAFGAVLLEALVARGTVVVCCPPEDGHIAEILGDSSFAAWRIHGVYWIPGNVSKKKGAAPVLSIAPLTLFAGQHQTRGLVSMIDTMENSLHQRGWRSFGIISELIMELVQNVITHAGASHAALVALILPRLRPECIQIGVADNGIGIAASVSRHPLHGALSSFSDARATEAVLGHHLSGRRHGDDKDPGGGVLSDLLQNLIATRGASLRVRSGSGSVSIMKLGKYVKLRSPTYGVGTQYVITIPRAVS